MALHECVLVALLSASVRDRNSSSQAAQLEALFEVSQASCVWWIFVPQTGRSPSGLLMTTIFSKPQIGAQCLTKAGVVLHECNHVLFSLRDRMTSLVIREGDRMLGPPRTQRQVPLEHPSRDSDFGSWCSPDSGTKPLCLTAWATWYSLGSTVVNELTLGLPARRSAASCQFLKL